MTATIELTLELPCPDPGQCYCCGLEAIKGHAEHLATCLACAEYLEAVVRREAARQHLKRLRYDLHTRSLDSGRLGRANRRQGKRAEVVTLRPVLDPEKGGGA